MARCPTSFALYEDYAYRRVKAPISYVFVREILDMKIGQVNLTHYFTFSTNLKIILIRAI